MFVPPRKHRSTPGHRNYIKFDRVNSELKAKVFEPQTKAGSEYLACQDSGVAQILKLIVSDNGKILNIMNLVVRRRDNKENSSLPVAVRVSKMSLAYKLDNRELISKCVYDIDDSKNWPELLETWLALTSVNYHRNVQVSIFLSHAIVSDNHASTSGPPELNWYE